MCVIDAIRLATDAGRVTSTHTIWFVAYPGVQSIDLVGPHDVFASANRAADALGIAGCRYDLHVIGSGSSVVRTETGLELCVEPLPPFGTTPDTLVLPGGDGVHRLDSTSADARTRDDAELMAWIETVGARTPRLACVCTGTFLAAHNGLIDGRTVTTHWAHADRLRSDHPGLTVEQDAIYVRDEHVWTSAGVTAGIDLALALVEDDLGTEVAQEVARWLVVFLRRPGGQSQFAPTVWSNRSADGPIRRAQELIDLDPAAVGSVAQLADRVGLSPRHFTRRFTAEIDESPSRYIERVRLAAARQQLECTSDSLATIADRCGLGTAETLRRVFHRHVGTAPDDYRRRFSRTDHEPVTQ